MKIEFQDLQDEANPLNGGVLDDPAELIVVLERLVQSRAPMCQLIGNNGFSETIGLSPEVGCVQHAPSDGTPPYLMAVDPTITDPPVDEMQFVVGDTATPIDGRFRLSFTTLKRIVTDFVMTGQRSKAVNWEEF